MDAPPFCPGAGFAPDPALDARLRADERLIAAAVAAFICIALIALGCGYCAAPGPLDAPPPRCAHHAAER